MGSNPVGLNIIYIKLRKMIIYLYILRYKIILKWDGCGGIINEIIHYILIIKKDKN